VGVIVIDAPAARRKSPPFMTRNLSNAVLLTIFTGVPDATVMAFGLNTVLPSLFVTIRETVAVLVVAV